MRHDARHAHRDGTARGLFLGTFYGFGIGIGGTVPAIFVAPESSSTRHVLLVLLVFQIIALVVVQCVHLFSEK